MLAIPRNVFGHKFHPIFQKNSIASMRRLYILILAFILMGYSLCYTLIRFLQLALCVRNICILKSMKIIICGRLLFLHLSHYRTVSLEVVHSSIFL